MDIFLYVMRFINTGGRLPFSPVGSVGGKRVPPAHTAPLAREAINAFHTKHSPLLYPLWHGGVGVVLANTPDIFPLKVHSPVNNNLTARNIAPLVTA